MSWPLFFQAVGLLWCGTVVLACAVALPVGIMNRLNERADIKRTKSMRHRLLSTAYWFSEDESTMRLLEELAEGEDVSAVRDKWRKRRAALAAEGESDAK